MESVAATSLAPSADPETRVLTALIAAQKALRLYPPSNPQVGHTLDRLEQTVAQSIRGTEPLVLQVERDRFATQGRGLALLEGDLSRLAFKLHCLNVRELTLEAGLTREEMVALLGVLNQPYETLRTMGPLSATLASRGVSRAQVRFAEAVQPGRAGEAPAGAGESPAEKEPLLRHTRHMLGLLSDPSQLARELVRMCVEVIPEPGQRRLEAQLAFVDRFLLAIRQAIDAEPAESRPALYEQLAGAIEALVRSADVSGARMGGLPRIDMNQIDPRLLEVLPQRDLVKEMSSKVKLHQGATWVMASALNQLRLSTTGEHNVSVLRVIEEGRESAQSVSSNMQVLDEIRAGQEVDGEYPGIAYAERDRNKNFALPDKTLPAAIGPEDRKETQRLVDALHDWRPEIDSVETVLDMLFNEQNPNFTRMISVRLTDKLGEFLEKGELERATDILRGLNVERKRRRDDPDNLAVVEQALAEVEAPASLSRLLQLAETLPVESPAFENVKSFLFLLEKRVLHTLVDLVAVDEARFSRRRVLALAQFLCRNRVDLLAEGLRSPRSEAVKVFVWLLGRFGPSALPHLRRAAHHPDPRVRREVVRSLAAVEGEEAARVMVAMLADRDDGVVSSSLRALVARGAREAQPAIDASLANDAFSDRSEDIAAALLRAAARLGGATTLGALRRLEERGSLFWMRRGAGLKDAVRTAARELDERLRGMAAGTGA